MNNNSVVKPQKVLTMAGSFIALLIGSGFATGQEIMQYFASYGWWGVLGVVAIFILLTFVGQEFITAGYEQNFDQPNDVYTYFAGDVVGKFYDIFSIIFLFLSYIVMLAGSGATVVEQYQLPNWVGTTGMMFVVLVVVILGLDSIVDIVGNIGPVIVVLSILVGGVSIFKNMGNIQEVGSLMQGYVESGEVITASNNFLLAAFNYVGFCLLWLAGFLSQVGTTANSRKEAKLGGFFGSTSFSIGVLVMTLGLFLGIEDVAGSQIPALLLAQDIHPLFGVFFSITILLGIFTTSVPLLWTVVSRFSEEGTTRYRLLAVGLAVVGYLVAMFFDFDVLVNYVYVINGYVGIFLLLIMAVQAFRRRGSVQTEA